MAVHETVIKKFYTIPGWDVNWKSYWTKNWAKCEDFYFGSAFKKFENIRNEFFK